MAKHWNRIATIVGRKGSGKTELAKYITQNADRLIVWDFLGQFECNDVCNHTAKIEYAIKHSSFNIAVRLPEHYFPIICQWVKQIGNCTFLIDEIDMVSSPSEVPAELNYLIQYGRHCVGEKDTGHGVDLIATARRAAEIPRAFTANSDDIFVYQTHEPRDLTYLGRFMRVEDITSLQEYEALHYNVKEQSYEKIQVPSNFVKE